MVGCSRRMVSHWMTLGRIDVIDSRLKKVDTTESLS